MATLWGSCLTLEGLFRASALGQPPGQGNAWLQRHVGGRLMQEAATIARIAAELHRLVDQPSQEVPHPVAPLWCVLECRGPRSLVSDLPESRGPEGYSAQPQSIPRSAQAMK